MSYVNEFRITKEAVFRQKFSSLAELAQEEAIKKGVFLEDFCFSFVNTGFLDDDTRMDVVVYSSNSETEDVVFGAAIQYDPQGGILQQGSQLTVRD